VGFKRSISYSENAAIMKVDLTRLVKRTICTAGRELERRFDSAIHTRITRHGINPQTVADIKANSIIIEAIRRRMPEHDIKSEETPGGSPFDWNGFSDYVWIVDPCDGTANFISHIPFFSVSVALAFKKEVIFGIVYDPIRKEMFTAEKGRGARLNGAPIGVGKETKLENATFGIDMGHNQGQIRQEISILRALAAKVRVVRSFYSGALELCYVACGRIDIRIDDSYKPWDVAAGALIAKEAGAQVTDLGNKKWKLTDDCRCLVAANRILHRKVVTLLSETKPHRGTKRTTSQNL
jgi:myo-inositol-1(or 4)-monophosphatase